MNTVLFVAVAISAGAACPLHMWWQRRRGREAACCTTGKTPRQEDHVATLQARQRNLGDQIARMQEEESRPIATARRDD